MLIPSLARVSWPGFHSRKTNSRVRGLRLSFSLFTPPPQEDDDGPLGAPEYDTISENGLLSRNEPIRSKVSKLTEKLRKRYPTTSTGQSALTHPPLYIAQL